MLTNNKKLYFQRKALDAYQANFSDPITKLITEKEYFWFLTTIDKKYIYKPALKFYYSDGCSERAQDHNEIFNFYRKMNEFGSFFPKLEETEDFFIMNLKTSAKAITSLGREDCLYIKDNYRKSEYTPFCYNSMAFNIVKDTENRLFLVDIKHINKIPDNKLFVYFYNKEFKLNKFYELEDLTKLDMEKIFKELSRDYDVYNCEYFTREDLI